jgi:hypothetical protein
MWNASGPAAFGFRRPRHGQRQRLLDEVRADVSSAVAGGRRLDDDRLRRAAVAMGKATLSQLGPRWREGTRAQRVALLLAVLWLMLLVIGVVLALATSDLSQVPRFGLVAAVAVIRVPVWQRRKVRQAIELNSAPAIPEES